MKIAVFICINQEDFEMWWKQLSGCLKKLKFDVSWYLDDLSEEAEATIRRFPLTFFAHNGQAGGFTEKSRQFALDACREYDWALQLDSDEVIYDRKKIIRGCSKASADIGRLPIETVWMVDGNRFLRKDSGFSSTRTRLYRMAETWCFLDVKTNGPYKMLRGKPTENEKEFFVDTPVYHWGLSTKDLRLIHKERWDRVYGKHGGNPYSFWDYALDETVKLELEPW